MSFGQTLYGQTNIRVTNSEAAKILEGNYNPLNYSAQTVIADHSRIICEIKDRISSDSLKSNLLKLESFETRHTYSDTLSSTTGIGAARRWVYKQFEAYSQANGGRLLPTYLEFDYLNGSCGDGYGFKNVLAVLPGTDSSEKDIIIIEAHMDSRCEIPCSISCFAPGADDNGSGSVLVMELARVMAKYSFEHTIVFMLTIGEEEGLFGAEAMSKYCVDKQIEIKAVQNNDIVGGITCGKTASPPGCPNEGHIDSTQLKIYSYQGLSAPNRSFARTVKMYYDEKLKPIADVPMDITVMSLEDRTGRGGDHIPFRLDGFRSIRFTSANEHGDANVGPSYVDRQHTSGDVVGIDTNNDNSLDEYYVDFNYLRRNAVINGMSAALLALGPETPTASVTAEASGLEVNIISPSSFYKGYRIAVRNSAANQNFDAVYYTESSSYTIPGLESGKRYLISVAAMDDKGIMSPFSGEVFIEANVSTLQADEDPLDLVAACSFGNINATELDKKIRMHCKPNPVGNQSVFVINSPINYMGKSALIQIMDTRGSTVDIIDLNSMKNKMEVKYNTKLPSGVYFYSLLIDGMPVANQRMLIY
ncbi:MAG: M28 family metallopeptidase [Bacteroidia bacterium]